MNRRNFLKAVGATLAGIAALPVQAKQTLPPWQSIGSKWKITKTTIAKAEKKSLPVQPQGIDIRDCMVSARHDRPYTHCSTAFDEEVVEILSSESFGNGHRNE